ncbi:MAG: methyltransferase domain-containing protein [Ferruginibacter sp.]
MFSHEQIARYYDLSQSQYEWAWQLKKSRALHYGWWDDSTRNFHEALENNNRQLSRMAAITAADTVLDAGCGIGGSSLWLARNAGCRVTGISLSEKQLVQARHFAAAEGFTDQISFTRADFCATGFTDASFDVVWAQESVCHANDKNEFVREAYRLLKPGGRLILADFFQQPGLTGADAALMQQWAHGWACDHFSETGAFTEMLITHGFTVKEIFDATDAIRPSALRLYRTYWPGLLAGKLYNLFHPRATRQGMQNISTTRLQYLTLQKGLWKYFAVLAVKP